MSDIRAALDVSAKTAQYDENAKELLSFDMVLANILVHATKEFCGMDPNEVASLIEGRPSVSTVPMDPGFTNERTPDGTHRITGDNNEDRVRNEGVTYYDVFFHVRTREGRSKVYINVEMQKDEPSGYDVEMRGIFYAAREISAQRGRDFKGDDYNGICPVYSIWIVMNTPHDRLDRIHLAKEDLVGDSRWKEGYDILNVVIARFGKTLQEDRDKKLHRLLGALFLPDIPVEEKEDILKNEFGIPIEAKEKEGISTMCNLGEGIFEDGYMKGMTEGISEGISRGISQGISQGRLDEIIDSVMAGDYSLERGAEKSGLSVRELEQKMHDSGRRVLV